jgi:formylglycine-generating enzyme required for sulfatase activity
MLNKTLFDQLVTFLLPDMGDPDDRKALIESALYGSPALAKLDWRGAAHPFTVQLIRTLDTFGEVEPGQPAVSALLAGLRPLVGADRQRALDDLLAQIAAAPAPAPLAPPETTVEGDLYVFISYARPDQAIAEQIETYLQAAGVRVFRDTSDIREGANWDMTIETALRACQRMVLLLSPDSMPYRKEVHREWFFFDQKRKPIYPLYVEACDLHSRLYAYNYIDVLHLGLQAALERLLAELGRDFALPAASAGADKIGVFAGVETEARTLPEALQALLDAVRDPEGSVVLSVDQAEAIKDHKPQDLTEYRLGRIVEWSLPRYQLDNRFVNLTLLLDKGEHEPQRWHKSDDARFSDLRDVLTAVPDPALVLLGAPGSGKSTLLRRLQLDHSIDRLRDGAGQISFFVQLNGYRARADGVLPEPGDWLEGRWAERYPHLPPLDTFLRDGQVLLLLDALNEMPHKSTAEYHERVGLWRAFTQDVVKLGNRVIFSCRSLDYSASLSSPELRVPQVEVQPMSADQVRAFLRAYAPAHEPVIWADLDGSPQFTLFQTPYFLRLLCEQVEANRAIPRGRASLFTGFVRQVLQREINGDLFQPDTLLSDRDHQQLALGRWRSPFDLPERGALIPCLSRLAFTMQEKGLETEGAQVRVDYDDACDLLAHERSADILRAGMALNVLDEDISRDEIAFFHQLLQEYFAARRLAQAPNPALVHVEWQVDQASPTLAEVLAALADGDPLPPLPQTGWEETTLTAAPLVADPNTFIRALIPHNLPLAARCAASPEVSADPALKRELRDALIARSQDYTSADLRARIAAGLALGELGDPRFERRSGPHGDYLLPPLVTIPAGTYPIGDDSGQYNNEKPAHTVTLDTFQIGMFPVTNAEYALFMAAGGYEDEQWWDTDAARAWLRGEGSTEGQKQDRRGLWKNLRDNWTPEEIQALVPERFTSEEAEWYIWFRGLDETALEERLAAWYREGEVYRQPEYWDDARFNNPAQPVVGVTWFEARAYCAWLSANALTPGPSAFASGRGEQGFRLPTEVEFEAAARGPEGRAYAYGPVFDAARSNTFESHIRRTTPVGLFANATPEGAFDLSGNVLNWTTTSYDPEQFPYPYQADERENAHADARRVLRGGSWSGPQGSARAAFRSGGNPLFRDGYVGFRVVCGAAPS